MSAFLAELQRRHVYKVGAMYCVAGWLLVQVVTQVFPIYDIPAAAQRVIVTLIVAGLPVALVLAWLFDITPQGIVRTADAPAGGEAPVVVQQRRGMDRKLNYVLGALLVLALGYFLMERNVPREHGTSAASDQSIAVLPFENLSDDKANAYFADGMQDEILTRLAKIGALKVISRTSTQHYASSPDNLPQIARELGVANILEGSVQKAGDAVHINVQLIRAASDEHLWAEVYDRKLDNIFGVEGEVAQNVADTLNTKLTRQERQQLQAPLTANPAAYDAYLRGLAYADHFDNWRNNALAALDAFAQATKLDPGFAVAWARLSRQYAYVYQFFDRTEANRRGALDALEVARRLAPDAGETLAAEGDASYRLDRDYAAARTALKRAQQQSPNDVELIWTMAAIAKRQGHWDESLETLGRLQTLAPRDPIKLADGVLTAMAMRRFKLANRWLDQGLSILPDDKGLTSIKIGALQLNGAVEEAHALLQPPHATPGDLLQLGRYVNDAALRRDYAAAEALLGTQLAQPEALGSQLGTCELMLADLHRYAGEDAAARPLYQAARASLIAALAGQPGSADLESTLAQAEAGLGNQAQALAHARRAIELLPATVDANDGPVYEEALVRLQARFGDRDAAIAGLQHLLATSYTFPLMPGSMRLDPDWDAIRADPRFARLLAESTAAIEASDRP